MSDAPEILNGGETVYERALRSQREARLRYLATDKGKASYERNKAQKREKKAISIDKELKGAAADLEWESMLRKTNEKKMEGVWYEDDPRAVAGRD